METQKKLTLTEINFEKLVLKNTCKIIVSTVGFKMCRPPACLMPI